MIAKAFVFALWLISVVATGYGATFYCDPTSGSPRGDGSRQRPWRTVEEVLSAGLVQLCDKDGKPLNRDAPVKPGDTVLLRSGWHGVIHITRGYNDRPITIAADKGCAPEVGWIEIGEGRRWLLKGLTVSPSLAPAPLNRPPRHLVMLGEQGGEESAELVVEDCFIYSVLDTAGWTAKDWVQKPASGIWLGRHGKGHVARNNYVLNTRFGIELCAPECLCEGNVVANFSADGIRATRDGQIVQYNVIKNNFVGARDGDPNHDDGIQAFLFNVGTGTLRNITIRGNIILARETDGLPFPNPLQGIGCFDGPLVNFTVEKNVVCVNHWHGVSLYDAQGCMIRDNVCFSRWKDRPRPWVMIGQKKKQSRGNTLQDNLAHSFNFQADPEVKAQNNREVTEAAFSRKLADLAARIDARFGRLHPTAKRPRLEQTWKAEGERQKAPTDVAQPPSASPRPPSPVYPVKVSENGRYFVDQRGNPVFWLGTTQWQLFREYTREDARTILEKTKAKGFAFAQVMLMGVGDGTKPNVYGEKPWINDNPLTPNEAYFRNVDAVVGIARENNVVISMTLFHQRWRKYITVDNARAWARWVAARYRDVPTIVWSMTPEAKPQFVPILRELAAGLHEGDGGAHLITFKPDPAPYSSSFIHGEKWLDFDSMQTWNAVELIYPMVTKDYHLKPVKPVLMAEGAYEHGSEYGFDVTPLWVRRQAYYSYLAGGHHTYGHNDSWRVLPTWKQALDAPGATQLGILKRVFLERKQWWRLVPDQSVFASGGNTRGKVLNLAARHEDGQWIMVYLGSKTSFSVHLNKITAAGRVKAFWIDPRTGQSTAIGLLPNTGVKAFSTPDGWEDALLILEASGG